MKKLAKEVLQVTLMTTLNREIHRLKQENEHLQQQLQKYAHTI